MTILQPFPLQFQRHWKSFTTTTNNNQSQQQKAQKTILESAATDCSTPATAATVVVAAAAYDSDTYTKTTNTATTTTTTKVVQTIRVPGDNVVDFLPEPSEDDNDSEEQEQEQMALSGATKKSTTSRKRTSDMVRFDEAKQKLVDYYGMLGYVPYHGDKYMALWNGYLTPRLSHVCPHLFK